MSSLRICIYVSYISVMCETKSCSQTPPIEKVYGYLLQFYIKEDSTESKQEKRSLEREKEKQG